MKKLTLLLFCFFLAVDFACAGLGNVIELTKDNPSTIVSTKSKDYTIYGLRLGLTHQRAWRILEKLNFLIGVQDKANPSRIYVYSQKGKGLLYLIWKPGEKTMSRITVFQDFHPFLSLNFKRLLTFEAVDKESPFKRKFIGYANRSKTTLNMPSINVKHITYFYDEIGLEITYQYGLDGDKVVFALVGKP